MKKGKYSAMLTASLVFAVSLILLLITYIYYVQTTLWTKSVTDILEITQQGRNTLDTFVRKDYDTLRLFSREMSRQLDGRSLLISDLITKFATGDDALYVCMDLDNGVVNNGRLQAALSLDELQELTALPEEGMTEPFPLASTGELTIGVFARFSFRDGSPGVVSKLRPLSVMKQSSSIPLYGGTGFSFVAKQDGTILVHEQDRVGENFFDLLSDDARNAGALSSLQHALGNRETGAEKLLYAGAEWVLCYVPMESVPGWYILSAMPAAVITAQASRIIWMTIGLCALLLTGVLVLLYLYRKGTSQHEQQMEWLAYYDSLTGLYSFEKFRLEGNKRLTEPGDQHWALLHLDIVGFKVLNDINGYQYGDYVLCLFAEVLSDICPGGLAGRVSADQFVVLLPYAQREDVSLFCSRVAEETKLRTGGTYLALRIGICCQDDAREAEGVSALIDRALMAQNRIRGNAEGGVNFYSEEMRAMLLREAELDAIKEQALYDGEFVFYIQPKFDVYGKRLMGGEALARWLRPGIGVVNPSEFVPIFERDGFILRLDEHIYTSLCHELRRRLDAGLPTVRISVNISRAHLFQPEFVPTYIAIKRENGIPDGLIELELTESILLEDIRSVRTILDELKLAGFSISIDDFGSGYSSLNALKELPTDTVKLDKEFLTESGSPGKAKTILHSVINMAKELEMTTVAEGVENEQQLAFLQNAGCDLIQGFIFSRPLPVVEFNALLDGQTNEKET